MVRYVFAKSVLVPFPTKPCQSQLGQVCIEVRKCPYFDDLLKRSTIPRPRNIVKIIREKHCGFHGNTPYVCCSVPTTQTETTTKVMDATTTDIVPPSIKISPFKYHPNYNLLPNDICGPISTNSRITNGKKTDIGEFPWMALIAYNSDGGIDFRCGGTLISEWFVLTAAHCISNTTIAGVRLGEHDIDNKEDCSPDGKYCAPPTQDYFIMKTIIHPEYNARTFANDIALVVLSTPANLSLTNVKPICLPFGDSDLSGRFATVSGWGVTEDGYKSAQLLKVSMPVLPISHCQSIYQNFAPINEKQICAGGYKGRDSCGGDSGGPLSYVGSVEGTIRYMQFGIVSYGPRHCGTDGKPGIYTRVSEYLKWILDNIGNM